MLQFGQSSTAEHWRQITDVAKPRRLSRIRDCSWRSSRSAIALANGRLSTTSSPACAISSRMLTTVTLASGRSSTRFCIDTRVYLPSSALAYDSMVGVAEPSTTSAFANLPRMIATSRP